MAAYTEATQLAGFSEAEAAKFFGRPRGLKVPGGLPRLKPTATAKVERRYRQRIEALQE